MLTYYTRLHHNLSKYVGLVIFCYLGSSHDPGNQRALSWDSYCSKQCCFLEQGWYYLHKNKNVEVFLQKSRCCSKGFSDDSWNNIDLISETPKIYLLVLI